MFKFCKLLAFFVLILSSCSREEQIAAAVSVVYMASPLNRSGKLLTETYDNSMRPEVAKIDKECKEKHTYNGILDNDEYKLCFDQEYNEYEKKEFFKQIDKE
ncbi:MAG: hypothetical protein MJ247_04260 [Alphaproteobacteria bacterium]|nr:hypothetical protein [Alphaproteobacteria bacterium]